MKILLADDNLPSRELLREILETRGHCVMEASNGRDALDLIRQDQPELVLLDLQMPGMDGFRVIQELRRDIRFRRLPVIAVTASAMMGDRERAIAAGFDSYIAKPINSGELRRQLELLSSHDPNPGK